MFRRVLPLLSRGAKAVGKEALRTGANVISDVATRNTPFADSFKTRVKESGEVLKRKADEKLDRLMEGSGYIDGHSFDVLQSLNNPETSSNRKRKRYTLHKIKKNKKKRRLGTLKQKKKKKKSRTKSLKRRSSKNSKKKKKSKRLIKDIFD